MWKSANPNLKEDETTKDYIFRYKLDLEPKRQPVFHHRLAEFVRVLLENLLDIIVPLRAGEDIRIDSFRWLMNKEQEFQLFSRTENAAYSSSDTSRMGQRLISETGERELDFQNIANATFYEPRINMIKQLIESLLTVVELEYQGKPVRVDGFRLKNLQDWLVASAGDPSEIIDYTGSHCNCDCVFCCNKGNPPSIAVANAPDRTADKEFAEIKTRMKYFSPKGEKALFPSLGCVYETAIHPHFMDVLKLLRKKTSKPFRITTNGSNLTPSAIMELAELKPVYLYISLNSSSPSRRRKLMRDPSPEIAINALPLLRQYRIPFAAIIVPWPTSTASEMFQDLSSTIAYAAENEAHLVQINLPGYTKYFPPAEPFDLHQLWKALLKEIRELREKHDLPIIAMPTLYEENIYHQRKNSPQVIGLVKNSPAYLCGLKRGDEIRQINGIPVHNRPQARDLISLVRQSGAKEVSFTVERDNQTIQACLDLSRYSYPYTEDTDTYFGIVFMGTGLRMSYIESLKEIVEAHRAEHVLFLSSELVKPTFEQCLAESHLFGGSQCKIDIEVPKNNFFGGNIFMGDLLVVQDFIDHIKNYIIKKGYKPDLVIIPSSPFNLSGWGRDLTGRVYLDIERETGVPVELLPCATIYD